VSAALRAVAAAAARAGGCVDRTCGRWPTPVRVGLGAVMVAAGAVLVPLPGPGIPILFVGLKVLGARS
jgi:hypothetical protein